KFQVRDAEIVADQLNAAAKFFRQLFPVVPIILGTTVLDGNNRKPRTKLCIVVNQFFSGFLCAAGLFKNVETLFSVIDFRRSGIERDKDLFAQRVTYLVNGRSDRL